MQHPLLQRQSVVICFKFSNFAYANTVRIRYTPLFLSLLFALNLVTLLMQIQYMKGEDVKASVVICFKFSNFAYANTVKLDISSQASSCYLL